MTTTKPQPEPYFCLVATANPELDMRDTLAELIREVAPLIPARFTVDSAFLKAGPHDPEPSFMVSISTKELPDNNALATLGPHVLAEVPGVYRVNVATCDDMRTLEGLTHREYFYGVEADLTTPRIRTNVIR